MADKSQGHRYGPVQSGMEEYFGHDESHKATDGGIYNGMPGYPKGSPTKAAELTFDESGNFGKVKPAKE